MNHPRWEDERSLAVGRGCSHTLHDSLILCSCPVPAEVLEHASTLDASPLGRLILKYVNGCGDCIHHGRVGGRGEGPARAQFTCRQQADKCDVRIALQACGPQAMVHIMKHRMGDKASSHEAEGAWSGERCPTMLTRLWDNVHEAPGCRCDGCGNLLQAASSASLWLTASGSTANEYYLERSCQSADMGSLCFKP